MITRDVLSAHRLETTLLAKVGQTESGNQISRSGQILSGLVKALNSTVPGNSLEDRLRYATAVSDFLELREHVLLQLAGECQFISPGTILEQHRNPEDVHRLSVLFDLSSKDTVEILKFSNAI